MLTIQTFSNITGRSCYKLNFYLSPKKRKKKKKSLLSRQKNACHDNTFVATKLCFVATSIVLLRQKTCFHDKSFFRDNFFFFFFFFIATKVLLRQAYFCRDERRVFSRQNVFVATKTHVCRHKHFVARKVIFVAAPASDI